MMITSSQQRTSFCEEPSAAPIAPRRRVLIVAPLPPPYAGPELMTESLLRSSLQQRFCLHVIPARFNLSNQQKGRVTAGSLMRLIGMIVRLVHARIRHGCRIAYLYLSQNRSGVLRDSVLFTVLRLLGVRVVWHLRGGNLDVFYRCSPPLLRAWMRWMLNHSQALIVLGPSLVARLRAIGLTLPMHVVPNWAPVSGEMRNRFSAPALKQARKMVTVLALGSVSVAKGTADLLRAADKVLAGNGAVRFVIAGECIENERNILRDESGNPLRFEPICELLTSMQTRYPGSVQYVGVADPPRKWELLRQSDLLVLPSYSEGFPITLLEAMFAGLPVITTPVGAIPDFLRANENARFVAPGDVENLAKTMLELISDPDERLRIGRNNYHYVRATLTLEKSASLIGSVLENASTR